MTRWDPDDLHRTPGMTHDGFGNAAKQETIQGLSAVRPKHDQIGMPLFSGIDDQGFWLALLDGGGYLYAVGAEGFRGIRNQSLRLLCFFVPNRFQSRVISSHVASDEKRGRLHDM